MKISFYTLGCKLNQAETEELKKSLSKEGFLIVPFGQDEDIAVIRACGVTCKASQTGREIIRRAKKSGVYTVAAGYCLENKKMKEIDFYGSRNEEIVKHLKQKFGECLGSNEERIFEREKTRKFIKIQNGCNFQCAYCIIPSFRGKSQSIKTSEIVEKVKEAVKEEYLEIVLTGVNIGQYRDDDKKLADLLTEILEKTRIERIRLGSLDPRLMTRKLIDVFKNPRMMPHVHLSLQSGSDEILKKMTRGYNTEQYKKTVDKLRKINPLFSITTDIIVGFPGETEKNFQETIKFVKEMEFCKVHIFPFSPRPNTPAALLKPIHNQTVTNRVKQLEKIAKQTAKKFISKFVGQRSEVLFERKRGDFRYGYSPQYFPVKKRGSRDLDNRVLEFELEKENL